MARGLGTLEVRTCIFHRYYFQEKQRNLRYCYYLGRLIRLVPEDGEDAELTAIKNILNYRLPPNNKEARIEWLSIIEGTHYLWKGVRNEVSPHVPKKQSITLSVLQVSSEKRELLRSFFILLNLELLKRQRPRSSFNFQSASIGNLFLTGARIFFGSFESAIYLFRSIAGIPENVQVIPAINSNHAHHIAAGLADSTVIIGQNQISHPSSELADFPPSLAPSAAPSAPGSEDGIDVFEEEVVVEEEEEEEDANLPGSLASLRTRNIEFSKNDESTLSSRIERIWYINPYGQEIRPPANPKVLSAIEQAEAVIYSIGSLYTSLTPCLVLRNVGSALAATGRNTPKILLLNGFHDRETGPDHATFTATEFVRAVARSCASSDSSFLRSSLMRGEILKEDLGKYVTHVIYLTGNGSPVVDVVELKRLGIECFQVYGRKNPQGDGRGMLYDATALTQTLETILAVRFKRQETRRMTMDTYGHAKTKASGNGNGWSSIETK